MENEMKNKKGNSSLVILTILLMIVCAGLGGFVFVNKDKLLNECATESTTINNEKVQKNNKTEKCDEVSYDINTNEYGLSAKSFGVMVNIDRSRTKVTIKTNNKTLNETFGLQMFTADDSITYEEIDTKTFSKKVNQVLIDGAGQDASGAAIIYLMEDGTVEYTPILKDFNANWGNEAKDKFNSYGKLDGVSNIISLIPAEANGYHTVLARQADGTVIDLANSFQATGNF